jgi:hypothetical protein
MIVVIVTFVDVLIELIILLFGPVGLSLSSSLSLTVDQLHQTFHIVDCFVNIFPNELICVRGSPGVAASTTDKRLSKSLRIAWH